MKAETQCFLVLGALLGVPFALPSSGAWAASDPQSDYAVAYQNNPAHSGFLSEPGGLKPPLKQAWSINLGGAVSYPLIAENMVFVTAANPSGYGTLLVALDRVTGTIIWQKVIGGSDFWSNAAYDQGTIFLINSDGLLQAFTAKTGLRRWYMQFQGQIGFDSPPTAVNGIVYAATSSGEGAALSALSETTGKLLWAQGVSGGGYSAPAVDASGIYLTYSCEAYRFGFAGNLVWNYNQDCDADDTTAVLHRGIVFMRGFGASDVTLQESNGKVSGSFTAAYAPAFWGDTMVFFANSSLQAQSLSTGKQIWTFAGDGALTSAALIVNGVAYEGSSRGNIYGLSINSGKVIWTHKVSSAINFPGEGAVNAPVTGFGAGQGTLVVPAGSELFAFTSH